MTNAFSKLIKITKEYPSVDIFQANAIFAKACQRVYHRYIEAGKITMKHFISDDLLDNEALDLTSRYLRMFEYKSGGKKR